MKVLMQLRLVKSMKELLMQKTWDGLALTADGRLPAAVETQELARWYKREQERMVKLREKPMRALSDGLTGIVEQVRALVANNPNRGPDVEQVVKCRRCQGARFVRQDVAPTHPNFGKALRCPACAKPWQNYRQRLEGLWPVPSNILKLGGEGIDLTGEPELARLVRILGKIFESWPMGVIIALDGGYGSAKSHSLAIIYRKAWEAKVGAVYLESAAQLEAVFTQFEQQEERLKIGSQAALQRFDAIAGEAIAEEKNKLHLSRQRLIAELVAVPWLLVDEAHRYSRKGGNGWVERHLANLVNARLLRGNTTVFAGNGMGDGNIIGRRGPNRLHPSILDRITSSDCLWLDLNGVQSGRPRYGRNAGKWWES
jgi:hypothetical protein